MQGRVILLITLLIFLSSAAHARFSKFVHVAPGIEKNTPSMPYSIVTDPALTISPSSNKTFLVVIPLEQTRQHQQYWVIRCTSSIKEEQMNFRQYVWKYERYKIWKQGIENHERLSKETKAELIKNHGNLKTPSNIEAIEHLNLSKDSSNIVLEIPESEIDRTYIYRDYPIMVEDGGYYYCFDIPAYYIKYKLNQSVAPTQ